MGRVEDQGAIEEAKLEALSRDFVSRFLVDEGGWDRVRRRGGQGLTGREQANLNRDWTVV